MMDVLVVAGGHYFKKQDGTVYAESLFDYAFYSRYLDVFENVYTIARITETESIPDTAKLASGEGVHFLSIPETRGPKEYLYERKRIIELVRRYVKDFQCAIFRISESTAHLACKEYMKTGKGFAVEIIVDPWEFFSPGTVKSVARPIVRLLWTFEMKRACFRAKGVAYVTEEYLQKRYPCKAMSGMNEYFMSHYSSVEIPDDSVSVPRIYRKKDKHILVHVSNAFTGYGKGQKETMKVVREVLLQGHDVEAWFVGDGPLSGEFKKYAVSLNVGDKCKFLGRLPDSMAVRNVLKEADLMVFPTRGEGLPRAILEAMAEGLPVISTPVCGIPEIIERDMLFKPTDIKGMSDKICELIDNLQEMERISAQNVQKAYQYRKSKLQKARKEFYQKVKDMGEATSEQ